LIRILEHEANAIGDRFARLMSDLFLTLGYEGCRININRSGREIDLEAVHRTENRRAIAECKATQSKTSGSDLNKFAGVADVERKQDDVPLQSYFISLKGFTEPARDQEEQAGQRMVLVDEEGVLASLIKGKVIVPFAKAAQRAGSCTTDHELTLDEEPDLLAHNDGWIWSVYFCRRKRRVAYALIHADGGFLDGSVAERVRKDDDKSAQALKELTYLEPPTSDSTLDISRIESAIDRYHTYLESEYGSIQIEGLPTDQELGTRRLKLEELYTPLHLQPLVLETTPLGTGQDEPFQDAMPSDLSKREPERLPVGSVLAKHPRVAVLAPPGGGKSTLLKRVATAYASKERSSLVQDQLPKREWLPLVIRCRQLNKNISSSIRAILSLIPTRAELPEDQDAFEALISETLRNGTALVLIDGLDEIAEDSDRIAFVAQLRTFLATYPRVALIVTSREAGFRAVGQALVDVCEHYSLSPFDDNDIATLTRSWYVHVVGDTATVREEAELLADQICSTDRLRRLAENPLLLTTLLLVRRCVGELPRKRSLLYQRAIDVLLMTWNVEGHKPIDAEEAIPQLAYVAFVMMSEEMRTISRRRLQELIVAARHELPEELSYAQMSPSEFVTRIEDRSSVLSMTGYAKERGRLVAHYEFKHLTFQEYLTAVSIVDGYYPGRSASNRRLKTLVRPWLLRETWQEVVPLVAVLSGREGGSIVELILDRIDKKFVDRQRWGRRALDEFGQLHELLVRCVGDEVKLTPDQVKRAVLAIASANRHDGPDDILESKYGATYRSTIEDEFFAHPELMMSYGSAVAAIASYDLVGSPKSNFEATSRLVAELEKGKDYESTRASLAAMILAYSIQTGTMGRRRRLERKATHGSDDFRPLAEALMSSFLQSDNPQVLFGASWALVWIASGPMLPDDAWDSSIYRKAFDLWRTSEVSDVRRQAAWLLSSLPILDASAKPLGTGSVKLDAFLKSENQRLNKSTDGHMYYRATLAAGYYLGRPWSRAELTDLLEREDPPISMNKRLASKIRGLPNSI